MKKIIGKIISGLILIAIAYWFVSSIILDRRVEEEKQELKDEKQLKTERSVADMAAKHNAVIDWRNGFDTNDLGLFRPTYTIEVEDALIRTDGRPIMFFAAVVDVARETNKYSVHFHNFFDLFSRNGNIHFVLDCTLEQIKEILLHQPNKLEKYAVITRISEVKKVKLKLTTVSENDETFLEPSNAFIAEGQCLDLLFVGN